MSLVKLNLPRSARVIFNNLYADRPNLTPDLLAIALPGGKRIDVSWYPEHDPDGSYTVTVFTGSWELKDREIEEPILQKVAQIVENLASAYDNPIRPVSWDDDDAPDCQRVSFSGASKELQFDLV